jgi:AcrR family transcriptional regulator
VPRPYDNTRRAADAARTADRIGDATEALMLAGPLRDVTLQAIAARAGVTVQTVLRHAGSRQGCLDAVADRVRARVHAQRGHTAPGDVDGALASLLDHYEAEGRLVLALLAQETDDPLARAAVEEGRAFHRAWVLRCFGPQLGTRADGDLDRADPVRVDALVAATDLFVWKLLRLDLGRSPEAVRAVVERLVRAALEGP